MQEAGVERKIQEIKKKLKLEFDIRCEGNEYDPSIYQALLHTYIETKLNETTAREILKAIPVK